MALTPDLGLASADQAYGFDSHVIIRSAPGRVWEAVTDFGGWRRFTTELRATRASVEPPWQLGATFRAGPTRALARAQVLVSEPPQELVFAATYFGASVRHGLRCEPYWHADEDEDAPAVSCRLVHSLASFGSAGRLLVTLGGLKALEDRFHRFNEDLRRFLEG